MAIQKGQRILNLAGQRLLDPVTGKQQIHNPAAEKCCHNPCSMCAGTTPSALSVTLSHVVYCSCGPLLHYGHYFDWADQPTLNGVHILQQTGDWCLWEKILMPSARGRSYIGDPDGCDVYTGDFYHAVSLWIQRVPAGETSRWEVHIVGPYNGSPFSAIGDPDDEDCMSPVVLLNDFAFCMSHLYQIGRLGVATFEPA